MAVATEIDTQRLRSIAAWMKAQLKDVDEDIKALEDAADFIDSLRGSKKIK